MIKLTGSPWMAAIFGLSALAAWGVIPVLVAMRVFSRQNL